MLMENSGNTLVSKMLYTTKDPGGASYMKVITFSNMEECRRFGIEVFRIKDSIADIHRKREYENRDDWNQQDIHLFRQWLHRCDVFVARWHKSRVPYDIRSAIQDVQRNLGFSETEFGEDLGVVKDTSTL